MAQRVTGKKEKVMRIVALSDGTWDICADIVTLSDDQYERLTSGEVTIADLYEEGIEAEVIQTFNREQ
jgi:hypothetical protein